MSPNLMSAHKVLKLGFTRFGRFGLLLLVAIVMGGFATVSNLVRNPIPVSARSLTGDSQALLRESYAGVYETASTSPAFIGGLGLFASGRYALILEQGGTQSGTWFIEGDTIRLHGAKSSNGGLLQVLSPGRLAYEHNGGQIIFALKEANDTSPSVFVRLEYPDSTPNRISRF